MPYASELRVDSHTLVLVAADNPDTVDRLIRFALESAAPYSIDGISAEFIEIVRELWIKGEKLAAVKTIRALTRETGLPITCARQLTEFLVGVEIRDGIAIEL